MESLVSLKNGRKGQMSIEFMMLVVLILVYINSVVQPTMAQAEISLSDTSRVAQIRSAAKKLANSIDFVSSCGAETKETVTLYVPKDANISCNGAAKKVTFDIKVGGDYLIQGDLGECRNYACNGAIYLNPSQTIDCPPQIVAGPSKGIKAYKATIFKDSSGVVHVS